MLAVAVIAAAGLSAFTLKEHAKKTNVTYHYTSSSDAVVDLQNINNWVAEEPGCGSTGDLPCAISFDGDLNDFQTYISELSTLEEFNAVATEMKEKP